MNSNHLPAGKLPPALLSRLIHQFSTDDPSIKVGPGIGKDAAVIETEGGFLVCSTDPITFTGENIGWYAVQINANDIVTSGAMPKWFLITSLFPEENTNPKKVEEIFNQVNEACHNLDILVIGGHTEITVGLDKPLLIGTMIGEVSPDKLVTPDGIQPGDKILLTKGVPIEATAILSRDFPDRLSGILQPSELENAQNYIHEPGISVIQDAAIATQSGKVTAMHDPTEGGVAAALWELAQASEKTLVVRESDIPIPAIAKKVCQAFHINPLAAIASGALLIAGPPDDTVRISDAMEKQGIDCAEIGEAEAGPPKVYTVSANERKELIYPEVDDMTKVYKSEE